MHVLMIAAFENVVIVLGYLALAVFVLFYLPVIGPTARGVLACKVAWAMFFVGCGITHTELLVHAVFGAPDLALSSGVGQWFIEWHGFVAHTLQAVGAPVALTLSAMYVRPKIFSREMYNQVLDQRIKEIENEINRDYEKERGVNGGQASNR